MRPIRLDYLQNPPLDKEASSLLIPEFNFSSIASKDSSNAIESYRQKLKMQFDKEYVAPFSFACGGFLEFFANFDTIYYVPSLHYEIRRAIEIISSFITTIKIPLHNIESANIESVESSSSLFIMPVINEDIFNINTIPLLKNVTLALDTSYAMALGIEISNADILLINGAALGLPNKIGLIASNTLYTSALYQKGVSEAFFNVINNRISNKKNGDTNMQLFGKLQTLLGDDIDLFANNIAPNTLPLRFKHINTRNLIQHLYLDDIYLQSSQDCYLGFIKPSHVLLELGYSTLRARELCAISFDVIDDIDYIADKLAQSYQMIRLMEF